MKNRIKLNVAIFLILLLSSMPLFASNTNSATANTIKTDNDKIVDINHFREVNFDKIFAYTNLSSSGFNLGGATKFNNIFLGGYYSGYFWGNITSNKNTQKYPTYVIENKYNYVRSIHNIKSLLGFNDMGFLFNLKFDILEEKNKNPESTSERFLNDYDFSIKWGGYTIEKEKYNFKPSIYLGLEFNNYTNKQVNLDNTTKIETTTVNYENTDPILTATIGLDLETGHNSKFYQEFGGSYRFIAGLNADRNIKTVTTLNTTTNEKTETIYHRNGKLDFKNSIFPRYRCEYKLNDKLTIGGRGNIGIHLNYSDSGITTPNSDLSKKTKSLYFSIAADFGIGIKYMLKPNLAINAGYTGTIPSLSTTTTTTIYKETSSPNADKEEKSVEFYTGNYSNSLNSGFTWNINKTSILDFGANIFVNFGDAEKTSIQQILKTSLYAGFTYRK